MKHEHARQKMLAFWCGCSIIIKHEFARVNLCDENAGKAGTAEPAESVAI